MSGNAISTRSVLFVPGSNHKAVMKAYSLGADAVVFDLEDSTADGAKADARQNIVEAIEQRGDIANRTLIRTNPVGSEHFMEDLRAVRAAGVKTIVLPKIESPRELTAAHLAAPRLSFWAMIESPRAVIRLADIAEAAETTPLEGLMLGPNDLERTAGVSRSNRDFHLPIAVSLVLAARAYGLTAIDGVFNDYRDCRGFEDSVSKGVAMGFDGKALIHPNQIALTHKAFLPLIEDIEWARKVKGLFEDSTSAVASLDGVMVERLHVQRADTILARAGLQSG